MARFSIEEVTLTYPIRDQRHPYNLWGFKQHKRRPKHKKKKSLAKKRGKIDIYV